jgi:hypothetical protein
MLKIFISLRYQETCSKHSYLIATPDKFLKRLIEIFFLNIFAVMSY